MMIGEYIMAIALMICMILIGYGAFWIHREILLRGAEETPWSVKLMIILLDLTIIGRILIHFGI